MWRILLSKSPFSPRFSHIEIALGVGKVLQNCTFMHETNALSITFVVVKPYFCTLTLGFEIVGEYLRALFVANATLDVQVVV